MLAKREKIFHSKTWCELTGHPLRKISLNSNHPYENQTPKENDVLYLHFFRNLQQDRICCTLIILVSSGFKLKITTFFKTNYVLGEFKGLKNETTVLKT